MPAAIRFLSFPLLAVVLVGCQIGNTGHPIPSVSQIGSDIKCQAGNHAFEDAQAGWGFCYPGTWKYNERANQSASPPGLDLTFDITDVPCSGPTPVPGHPSPIPICSPGAGLFAFMIISTYERGNATTLADWIQANLGSKVTADPIQWGNAVEAGKLSDGRRIALTPHHVVILDLRAGFGNLDLESEMSARLSTWQFLF
jgi:hypothetical protein